MYVEVNYVLNIEKFSVLYYFLVIEEWKDSIAIKTVQKRSEQYKMN